MPGFDGPLQHRKRILDQILNLLDELHRDLLATNERTDLIQKAQKYIEKQRLKIRPSN